MDQTLNAGLIHPIASLRPNQNKWVIKARVISKSNICSWSNDKREGKRFNMVLMDDSGEILATAFEEQCDKFYELIEVDKVFFISKCQLKPAYIETLKCDYEMRFSNETVVQTCDDDDDSGIPKIKYDLVPISQVANMEAKAAVDCLGVCKEVGELQVVTSKTTNKEFKKRDLTLVDTSEAAVTITIWGDEAVNFNGHVQTVILVKGASVNEFNGGKSLSLGSGSVMKINPDIPETHKLREWFDNGGGENITNSISARSVGGGGGYNTEWRTFQEARNLGTGDKPDYFQTKAVVHLIKSQNAYYKGCPQAKCNKKVIDEKNGQYRCEKCKAVFPNFKYKLLLKMSIGDCTSSRWVTCFNDLAEQLLGRSAQEIGDAMDNDPTAAEEMFSSIHFHSYIFKLSSKVDNEDKTKNVLTVQAATPINYKEYNQYLINNYKELTGY